MSAGVAIEFAAMKQRNDERRGQHDQSHGRRHGYQHGNPHRPLERLRELAALLVGPESRQVRHGNRCKGDAEQPEPGIP